jgi:hypothetical protein
MTTPSHFSQTGISVSAAPPILGTSKVSIHTLLSPYIESYSHVIEANAGYKSASIGLVLSLNDIEEWLENGLGRDISVYNEGGQPIWEGFVNDIEANIGGLTVIRGPLMDIANKVAIVYSTVDTSTSPPAVGVRTKTAYSSDLPSQARYGIIEKVLSSGGQTDANALYVRDTHLEENKDAETTPTQINLGGSDLSLRLNCLGYVHWLNAYTYNNTTTGTTTLSVRIQAVLTASPNNILSTDYSRITANTLSIPYYENDDQIAWDYIKGLLVLGDVAYNRYTFGVYANRRVYYTVMPTTQAYVWNIGDGGKVYTPNNDIVRPWDVLPARWAHIPDFMIGRISDNTQMRDDPRYMFIESLNFTAPNGLTLNGSKTGKLSQILGQLGLSGIGA